MEVAGDGITVNNILPGATDTDRMAEIISGKAAKTGKIGDGKIFVTNVDEAIRIRNDDRGETAL